MKTPICPRCGSVRVIATCGSNSSTKRAMRCKESDCGHVGARATFLQGGPPTGQSQHANNHWRDPVALSMDGYAVD